MHLSMIIPNKDVFTEVQQSLPRFVHSLSILNEPIQYLYDHALADDSGVDDDADSRQENETEMSIVNSTYEVGSSDYVANEYCPAFTVS